LLILSVLRFAKTYDHLLKPFTKDFKKLPGAKKTKLKQQLQLLVTDLYHPSLNARKMKGYTGVWEARIDYHYRITFKIDKDVVKLRRVGTHEIYRKP
jgi:mRNA interferase RelE/StbE